MLVVIAVIALLAAMIFPITGAINRNKIRTRTRGELMLIATAIDNYKGKLGIYPPDNNGNPLIHQLYYELAGTRFVAPYYTTLDGGTQIKAPPVGTPFAATIFPGPTGGAGSVSGFVNSSKGAAGGDEAQAVNFLKNLKPGMLATLGNGTKILICSTPMPNKWPTSGALGPLGGTTFNPIRYNSANPTNNPSSYDLWVDVIIDGKTNRISNWTQQPIINPPN
jgi:type II secretory pathway pseudopilin PulG